MSEIGSIKWFSSEKHYGFIRHAGKPDVFFHASGIKDYVTTILPPGQMVSFDIKEGKKGPLAVNVIPLMSGQAFTAESVLASIPYRPRAVSVVQLLGENKSTERAASGPASTPNEGRVRINELARELELKARDIIEVLPRVGEKNKKTHSSMIDMDIALKVRAHFGGDVLEMQELSRENVELVVDFQRLLDELISSRADLFQLSPRQFEELVAEIWGRFGFDVTLTKRTRDGGYDVLAIKQQREIDLKFLIECKRYSRDRKVDVSIVRSLYGVREHEGATKAVLATTSSFTQDAREFFDSHRWQLEGRDHDGVLDWARHASKMTRRPGELLWTPNSGVGH